MNLNLKNPIIFFDLETTGTNISSDRIVEISYLKLSPNGIEESKTMRINPECHIPEQSSAVHGIFDKDVENCPTFKTVAKTVAADFEGCDLAGYNSNRFDIPLLAEEFLRAEVDIDLMKHAIEKNDYQGVVDCLGNTLEAPSIKMVQDIQSIKDDMMNFGFDGALMSGSGSSVFGMTQDPELIDKVLPYFKKKYSFAVKTQIYYPEKRKKG